MGVWEMEMEIFKINDDYDDDDDDDCIMTL